MIPNKVYDILKDVIPMILLFSIVITLVRIISILYSHEKLNFKQEVKNLIYIIYCFCLFVLVTNTDFSSYSNNFTPFKEIMRYKPFSTLFIRNVVGNILLFLPFGYLITDMIHTKAKKCNVFITLLIVLLTSTSIELIQMYIGRSFDIDDIILNFIGGLFGYLIYFISHLILNYFRKKYNNIIVDIISILICIIVIVIFILYFSKVVIL